MVIFIYYKKNKLYIYIYENTEKMNSIDHKEIATKDDFVIT